MWTLDFFNKLRGIPPLLLRLAVGGSVLYFRSLPRLRPEGTWDWGEAWVADQADTLPEAVLYATAWLELLAAGALVLGLLTRWAAVGIFGMMVALLLTVHAGRPWVREVEILYAASAFALACAGPGSLSLDRMFFGRKALAP